jgi:hypothetical protein
VQRDQSAPAQSKPRQHCALAVDKLAIDERIQLLNGNGVEARVLEFALQFIALTHC